MEKKPQYKYNLNIRQAKDAVESARQTIPQHELVKLYHGNYSKKVYSEYLNDFWWRWKPQKLVLVFEAQIHLYLRRLAAFYRLL